MTNRILTIALSLSLFLGAGAVASDWQTGTYVYDGGGNIKSIGAEQFRYDAFGRLVNGTAGPGHTQILTYDAFGNIRTMTTDGTQMRLGVDTSTNRLTLQSVDGQPANIFGTYDAAGRLTSELAGVGNAFVYDGLDMVAAATVDGNQRVHFYTASDERIATVITSNGREVRSEWTFRDPGNRILRRLDRDSSQFAWTQDYIHHGSQTIAAEVATSPGTLHVFTDHLGSTRVITGNGGIKTAYRSYAPFGGSVADTPGNPERLCFTGHERDADSLDYMHARFYNAKWGRFLSVDPAWESADLGRPQSWNRYTYVRNSPVSFFDPDGRVAKEESMRRATIFDLNQDWSDFFRNYVIARISVGSEYDLFSTSSDGRIELNLIDGTISIRGTITVDGDGVHVHLSEESMGGALKVGSLIDKQLGDPDPEPDRKGIVKKNIGLQVGPNDVLVKGGNGVVGGALGVKNRLITDVMDSVFWWVVDQQEQWVERQEALNAEASRQCVARTLWNAI